MLSSCVAYASNCFMVGTISAVSSVAHMLLRAHYLFNFVSEEPEVRKHKLKQEAKRRWEMALVWTGSLLPVDQ